MHVHRFPHAAAPHAPPEPPVLGWRRARVEARREPTHPAPRRGAAPRAWLPGGDHAWGRRRLSAERGRLAAAAHGQRRGGPRDRARPEGRDGQRCPRGAGCGGWRAREDRPGAAHARAETGRRYRCDGLRRAGARGCPAGRGRRPRERCDGLPRPHDAGVRLREARRIPLESPGRAARACPGRQALVPRRVRRWSG